MNGLNAEIAQERGDRGAGLQESAAPAPPGRPGTLAANRGRVARATAPVATCPRPFGAKSRRSAFTLIEAIVVIIIIGVLATLIAPRLIGRIGQAKRSAAESNAAVLATQVKLLLADIGSMPSGASIDILWEKPGSVAEGDWKGPYVDTADDLIDPWGNKYLLKVPGDRRPDFDVVSYGQDGKPGGEGEDADVVK